MQRKYFYCTRCSREASHSCLLHKQQIQLFLGTEIDKLPVRKQYQCQQCTKIGFSSQPKIVCWFCNSTRINLLWSILKYSNFIFKINSIRKLWCYFPGINDSYIRTVLEVIISLLYGPFFLQISSVASTYIVTLVFFPLLSS